MTIPGGDHRIASINSMNTWFFRFKAFPTLGKFKGPGARSRPLSPVVSSCAMLTKESRIESKPSKLGPDMEDIGAQGDDIWRSIFMMHGNENKFAYLKTLKHQLKLYHAWILWGWKRHPKKGESFVKNLAKRQQVAGRWQKNNSKIQGIGWFMDNSSCAIAPRLIFADVLHPILIWYAELIPPMPTKFSQLPFWSPAIIF